MPYIDVPASSGASSLYWKDPVANFAALPASGTVGEVRSTNDSQNLYEWNGTTWVFIGGPGAVTGPAASVDSEIALFSSTSGGVIKRATGTGLVKVTSGVFSVQAAATINRALISDGVGYPTAATTTATEIGYVNGVTSAIQTQIDSKEPTITASTAAKYYRGDKTFVTLDVAALGVVISGAAAAAGTIGEVFSATQASNTTTGVAASASWGNATSLSLTAGVWELKGSVGFNENGATLTGGLQCGISPSSSAAAISEFDTTLAPFLISSTSDAILSTPTIVISISATTTYYLNTKFNYTAGTPRHRGRLLATRVR